MATLDEVRALIVKKGDEIRDLKAGGADKGALVPHIAELKQLKDKFQELNGGEPYDPPKAKKEKKEKKAPAENEGQPGKNKDKKDARKADKKAKRAAAKAAAKGGEEEKAAEDGNDDKTKEKGDRKKKGGAGSRRTSVKEDGGGKKKGGGGGGRSRTSSVREGGGGGGGKGGKGGKGGGRRSRTGSVKEGGGGGGGRGGGKGKPLPAGPPDTVLFHRAGGLPALAYAVAELAGAKLAFKEVAPGPGVPDPLPSLTVAEGVALFGDAAIARFLARAHAPALVPAGAAAAAAADQWLDLLAAGAYGPAQLAELLEPYLASRTYLAGHALSLADLAVGLALGPRTAAAAGPAVARWGRLLAAEAPGLHRAPQALEKLCAAAAAGATAAPGGAAGGEEADNPGGLIAQCPPLPGAEMGKVCTRFPPEPSGYLHIGHAKAVLLNNYYARHYRGKLIVRFDDTNPSKEKDEFVQNILKDLEDLGVKPDVTTHTSDSFPRIHELALQMIREGKAYMDDTPQEQMREERMALKDSARRGAPVEDNLEKFALMCSGAPEGAPWCLRAKIDMQSVNGTMRDPVMYRQNLDPHVRTGTTYKAYPTYDFACPIVDSVEGVTHALRTTEYNDRDEQYNWFQAALGLRPVRIHAFSRLNFVQTVLSKRKLAWFVDEGRVEGWNDPRFPTIQGVLRRGFSLDALRDFILSQGASRRVVNMQWDAFWATNKKYFEPTAPRSMAVFRDAAVPLTVTNFAEHSGSGIVGRSVPIHPQRPELGDRVMRLHSRVLLEGDDAAKIAEGESIVLMRWGVVHVGKVTKEGDRVVSLEGAFDPEGNIKKAKKKLTWLADVPDLVPAKLVEFDYLITKESVEEDERFEDFVNEHTRAETDGLADPGLRNLKEGEVIQLERRGFFRCDRPYLGPGRPLVLFMIPDGKTKAMSSLGSALKHR